MPIRRQFGHFPASDKGMDSNGPRAVTVRKGTETTLAWDTYGQATQVEDQGDLAVAGDETCTRTSYATPTDSATGPIDRVAEESVSPGTCSGSVNYATVLSAARHHYGTTNHTDPVSSPALETKTVQLRDGDPRP